MEDGTTQTTSPGGAHAPSSIQGQLVAQSPQTGPLPTGSNESLKDVIVNRVKGFIRGNSEKPIAVDSEPAQTLEGIALDADTPIATIVQILASSTGDTEDVIRGIEDNKEHPVAKIIIQALIVTGYVAPPILSVLVGIAIGAEYSTGLDKIIGAAVFASCVFYELGLVFLMFAIIKVARRVMSTQGKGLWGLFSLVLLYVGIAGGSSAAQWVIYEGHVNMAQPAQVAGAIIRTFAVPIVDLICAIALPILMHVSLDKRLAEIEKKTEAIIQINKKKILAQLALIQEAIATKGTLQKEKDYQSKNELANQLIDLISQKILSDARSSLDGNGTGNRRDTRRQ